MENSDKDVLLLSRTQSAELNTDIGLEPELEQQSESEPEQQFESEPEQQSESEPEQQFESEPEQQSESEPEQQSESEPDTQPESNQENPEPKIEPTPLACIEFRIHQLQNRRFLLQKTESLRNRGGYNSSRTTEGVSSEEPCELEAIEKELEDLLVKKEEMEKQGNTSNITQNEKRREKFSSLYMAEIPHGGIYMLPQRQPNQEEESIKTGPTAEIPIDSIIPVERLAQTSVVTRCPFCHEIISTKTSSSVSEAMWLLCCLCAMMGCVAGCCLIPFFTDSLKKVKHQCPRCWANISTYRPF